MTQNILFSAQKQQAIRLDSVVYGQLLATFIVN